MADKKWGAGTKADAMRIANDKRDVEFFAARRAQEAANLAKTEKLRALRLAHEAERRAYEATLPKPEKPARGAKKAKVN